jgi:recombination associated protein RdgC
MFFKNITAFRLVEQFELSNQQLAVLLLQFKSVEPKGQVAQTKGFDYVIDKEMVIESNGCMMFCVQQFDKVLPSSVINDEVDKRVAAIKEEQNRMVFGKEKSEIKDSVTIEFLPRAFVRQSKTLAYIDVKNGFLIVNTASQSKAEDVLSLLRKALDGFPALPIQTVESPTFVMTDWVRNWVRMGVGSNNFIIDDECKIVDAEQKSSIINVKNFDVTSNTITENVAHGMQVRSLALTYKYRVSFVLNSDFIIKRVKFLELAMEERGEFEAGNERDKFLADMILMTGEIRTLLSDLVQVFGGYRESN